VNNNVENFYQNQQHTNGNGNNVNNNHYYSSLPPRNEQVVMTPRGKTSNSTVILIERKLVEEVSDRVHVAGGDHQGIIINKDVVKGERLSSSSLNSVNKIISISDQKSAKVAAHLTLEFRVFLVSAKTEQHTQESRTIRFWFRDWLSDGERKAQVAQDFFRELVSPKEFPRGLFVRRSLRSLFNVLLFLRLRRIHQEDHEAYAERLQRDPID
jgi:hypothetical protein